MTKPNNPGAHLDGVRPIAVIGPTATGKSDLALDLAERLGGEIVNIDAMAQYRGMDIGTAKVPVDLRRGITHHQIDVLDVVEIATVARYQQAAGADIDDIRARGRRPIVVGGSMMYVQALLDGWRLPPTDPAVRGRWEEVLRVDGLEAVHRELLRVDPVAARTILPSDGRRMVRALEVVELTGRPFAASAPQKGRPRWDALMVGLDRDTDILDVGIAERTRRMFADGLLEEVERLLPLGLRDGVTARRAIGYEQALAVLDGAMSVEEAIETTSAGTRRYVRRQRSWFRRDQRISWFDPTDRQTVDQVISLVVDAPTGPAAAT